MCVCMCVCVSNIHNDYIAYSGNIVGIINTVNSC